MKIKEILVSGYDYGDIRVFTFVDEILIKQGDDLIALTLDQASEVADAIIMITDQEDMQQREEQLKEWWHQQNEDAVEDGDE